MSQKFHEKPLLSEGFNTKPAFQLFDAFFSFYQNKAEHNNEIVIKVK